MMGCPWQEPMLIGGRHWAAGLHWYRGGPSGREALTTRQALSVAEDRRYLWRVDGPLETGFLGSSAPFGSSTEGKPALVLALRDHLAGYRNGWLALLMADAPDTRVAVAEVRNGRIFSPGDRVYATPSAALACVFGKHPRRPPILVSPSLASYPDVPPGMITLNPEHLPDPSAAHRAVPARPVTEAA